MLREGTTLRALIEEGLRRVLEERSARGEVRPRRATFGGRGPRPEVCEGSWERIRDLIYDPPTPAARALDQIDCWLESPSLVLLAETPGYWQRLQALLAHARIAGPQVHDARVAALCLHHGVRTLMSADRDFGRFPQLRTENPLVG